MASDAGMHWWLEGHQRRLKGNRRRLEGSHQRFEGTYGGHKRPPGLHRLRHHKEAVVVQSKQGTPVAVLSGSTRRRETRRARSTATGSTCVAEDTGKRRQRGGGTGARNGSEGVMGGGWMSLDGCVRHVVDQGLTKKGLRAGGGRWSPLLFRRVAVSLRGPGQSPALPFTCCVGSLCVVGCCGLCSCWCRFRVRGAQSLVCRGCAGCGGCRLCVSGAQ